MKRFIALLLAMLMVFALAACGAKEEAAPEATPEVEAAPETAPEAEAAPEQEPVDVVLWTMANNEANQYKLDLPEMVKKYYPWINVIIEEIPGDSIAEKVSVAYATETCPDILLDGYSRIAPAVDGGLTVDLTDVYESNASIFYGAPPEGVRDGKHFYLPTHTGAAYCVVLNLTLAEELGVADMLPADWETWSYDEFLDLCRAVKAANPNVYATSFYAADQSNDAWDYAWMLGNGAQLLNADHTATAVNEAGNREKIIEVLELYQTMVEEKLVPDGVAAMSDGDVNTLFYSGQLLMLPTAFNAAPDTLRQQEDGNCVPFEVGACCLPSADGTEPPVSSSWGSQGVAVFDTNGNAEAAKLVVDAMLKDTQWRQDLVTQTGMLPIHNDVSAEYATPEMTAVMERGIAYGAAKATSDFGILEPFWSDFRGTFYPLKQDLFTGNITPEQFVEQWAAAGDTVIENYLSTAG